MIPLGGKKVRLVEGPEDELHGQLAEERFVELRKLRREAPEAPATLVADLVEAFLGWAKTHLSQETRHNYFFYGACLLGS
jgi:hypothetical protein